MMRRERQALAALSVGVLTALLVWGSIPRTTAIDRGLAALDAYESAQASLHRDLVSVRAGLLQNYDPVVVSVDRLTQASEALDAAEHAGVAAHARTLQATAARQAELAELLKSDCALLQNSLAYFSRLSAPARNGSDPQVSALAAAMLRLTLNTAPENRAEVASRLAAAARRLEFSASARGAALLAHARVIERLLPETDETLRSVLAADPVADRRALRAELIAGRQQSEAVALRVRIALALWSVVLAGLLINTGLQLRAHLSVVRRRAALERVVAEISADLVRATPMEVPSMACAALGRLGRTVGAARAYLVGEGPYALAGRWTAEPDPWPVGWPEASLDRLAELSDADEGGFLADRRGGGAVAREMLRHAEARAMALVWVTNEDCARALIGFDITAKDPALRRGDLEVLRMGLNAISGAVRRSGLEQARVSLERRLQAAHRMETIGSFASGIAHNFNNILAAIAGYAEMIGDGAPVGSHGVRHVEEIHQAVARARDLVDGILTFGQRRVSSTQAVAVAPLVLDAIALLEAAHDGARLEADPNLDLAGSVLGHEGDLHQVLMNLGANAIQASREGVVVRFGAAARHLSRPLGLCTGELAAGHYVVISVEDRGCGMDARTRARIFEPLFSTRPHGHGLGLATVSAIVQGHGGGIDVSSACGEGSRFDVWLPQAVKPVTRQAGEGWRTVAAAGDRRFEALR